MRLRLLIVQSLLKNSISVLKPPWLDWWASPWHTHSQKKMIYTSRDEQGSQNSTDLNLPGARGLSVCSSCISVGVQLPPTVPGHTLGGKTTPLRDVAVDDGRMEEWKGMMLSVEAYAFHSITGPEQFEALVYCWRRWTEQACNNMGVTYSCVLERAHVFVVTKVAVKCKNPAVVFCEYLPSARRSCEVFIRPFSKAWRWMVGVAVLQKSRWAFFSALFYDMNLSACGLTTPAQKALRDSFSLTLSLLDNTQMFYKIEMRITWLTRKKEGVLLCLSSEGLVACVLMVTRRGNDP